MKKNKSKNKNVHILKLTDDEYLAVISALESQKYSSPSEKELKNYPKDVQIRIKLELEATNRILKVMES